jgi:pimeloyl-ACP methyl ester carboxylesterase
VCFLGVQLFSLLRFSGKDKKMPRIESFLSARLFLTPNLVDDRIYFISNLSGRLSLYVMDYGGSVPEPLLPPDISLQNPHLLEGKSYFVFPKLNKILIMLDKDGDENYQPMLIPISGGYPEPAFSGFFQQYRVSLGSCDPDRHICYLSAESQTEAMNEAFQANLETGKITKLAESRWGAIVDSHNMKHTKVTIIDVYSVGDHILYLWERKKQKTRLIYGIPLEERPEGLKVPLNSINSTHFTFGNKGLLMVTSLFEDSLGLGYLSLAHPENIKRVSIVGHKHDGSGELVKCLYLIKNKYLLEYNIDGCTWLYEGIFSESKHRFNITRVIVGKSQISNGVLESAYYEKNSDRYIVSFSTATSPTQIYTIEGKKRKNIVCHTSERILGIPNSQLSEGEDASFNSFDGLRISARLYLPANDLNYQIPYPLVYYIHGGPQSQERPDFAWFSMPLIQYLTLNGFAVFVPNVRGSSGYGLTYIKHVDRDWGGKDRLDHVHAMDILKNDSRIDITRAGVVGRSYGGYMTLTMASRHPELWSGAVDMFGPYDLLTFSDRIPETWKPFFQISIGDPIKDHDFLVERSPRSYIDQIKCPLLVIQGKNDPRVIEQESRDLVEHLRGLGKQVEYIMFENEGHDVLKLENRTICYNAITDFFMKHLNP